MRQDDGDTGPAWDRLSEHLDRRTTVDRAIGVLMEQQSCDYWAAMRSLVVESVRDDVTVYSAALAVLQRI